MAEAEDSVKHILKVIPKTRIKVKIIKIMIRSKMRQMSNELLKKESIMKEENKILKQKMMEKRKKAIYSIQGIKRSVELRSLKAKSIQIQESIDQILKEKNAQLKKVILNSGVSLGVDQWKKLKGYIEYIDLALEELEKK